MRSFVFATLPSTFVLAMLFFTASTQPPNATSNAGVGNDEKLELEALETHLRELRVAHRDSLAIVVKDVSAQYNAGLISIDEVHRVMIEFSDAELAVEANPENRVKILLAIVERLKFFEDRAQASFNVGDGNAADYATSQAMRIHGEIRLAEERIRQHTGEK